MNPSKRWTEVWGCVLILAALLMGSTVEVLTAGTDRPKAGLVVHEWGTFTTFAGSAGVNLYFAPTAEDLRSSFTVLPGSPPMCDGS
jgi:hypothetical protein